MPTPCSAPPAICQPFEIGKAESLPWKEGPFGIDHDFDLATLNAEVIRILDADSSTLVHMETIRRAVVYTTGFSRKKDKLSLAQKKLGVESLIAMLRARALEPHFGAKAATEAQTAPRLFDLGFALAALEQLDWDRELGDHFGSGKQELTRAMQWGKADAAMHLGTALGMWMSAKDDQVIFRHFLKAAELAGDNDSLASTNLVLCGKRFYGAESNDELVSLLTKRIAKA
ncbi:MAG: hypothetical protein GY747_03855 [Planctomycetes bacterium]|nr:hypothetical protein [Planctomycetota bacterium]MCP4770938.1 hypothetical protein [Planctomycetota bacterium]MCP4861658.1 hypothetical protein [Planctomycetota bacterium]